MVELDIPKVTDTAVEEAKQMVKTMDDGRSQPRAFHEACEYA